VDSAWLHAPRRAYPVTLDLPLATAYSAVHSGLAATVNSCAPDVSAAGGEVVVGSAGGCASHGLLSFNTTPLLADTPIVSATLRLYTPDQIGPTGIRIYPNTPLTSTLPVWEPSPYLQPTWASAPTVVTGSVGIDQSGSDGRWQSWDVTDLVRGWVRRPATNGGLTLESDGSQLRVAVPGRVGRDAPAFAPYLDIVYGPRTSVSSAYRAHIVQPRDRGLGSIYGVSGDFAGPCGQIECGNKLGVNQAAYLGAAYLRVTASLNCGTRSPSHPGMTWWNGHGSNTAAPFSPSSVYAVLSNAYADGLVPIITFGGASCAPYLRPLVWGSEIQDFLTYMKQYSDSNTPSGQSLFNQLTANRTYFEIDNEINFDGTYGFGQGKFGASYGGSNYPWGYAAIFMTAAGALNKTLGNAPWVALTSGMTLPTADGEMPCYDTSNGKQNNPLPPNIGLAAAAIQGAEGAGRYNGYPLNVSTSHLGVAVHPYGYDTQEYLSGTQIPRYWVNYYGTNYSGTSDVYGPNIHYGGICGDLQDMIYTWTAAFPAPIKVVFTEDNYESSDCLNNDGCEGTYMVDLFTWLHDHNSYDNAAISPLIVAWFTGVDFSYYDGRTKQTVNRPLGLYKVDTSGGQNWDKQVGIPACSNNRTNIGGTHTIAHDYTYSINTSCY